MTSPVYARITPTNGVSGDKYSVSVTGVTATVDTQKTWSSGSSGGYVSFLLLRAFNDADINGVDAPYPRIIRAGKIGNIQTSQVITRNKSTQDFTDTNKFTLVLTNKSVLWYPMSVVRSVDRFTVYRTNTNSFSTTEFNYCIFQNYA